MNRGPLLGPHSLDAALEFTKRVQHDLGAELTAVDSDPGATSIYLSVPRAAVGVLARKRFERWVLLLDQNDRRRDH